MLKIGVSACFVYPDSERPVFGPKTLAYMEQDMAQYLTRVGVVPILIPNLEDALLKEFIDNMDGFVFQGGTDLSPASYGEEPIGRWMGDPQRDEYELRLMAMAMKTGKPILGICRGMQLMNVYFGGSLYQDTSTQREGAITHRNADLYDALSHEIRFTSGKILEKIYQGSASSRVNSVHHQSIKSLGPNLEILAECPEDNVIEAIGYTKAPAGWIMGVQWHPEFYERLKEEIVDSSKLYDCFLGQVKLLKSES
ncbi:MAG: gamma-glutamyl-gamma-aminobutyrate hydrolase family protein [Cyclobacteriaceae bacterium]